MAASRAVSTRRLCSRYKYFFYVAAVILGLQIFLGYSFYTSKDGDQTSGRATDMGPHEIPPGNHGFKPHKLDGNTLTVS
ncbi:hypothetical protein BaRGS_00001616 [Batillaria attramentaria]|uniref:Uncharacterized protein n=1 Tax=Batillaria attramentaria TaxID=370345 RepID=A0ABD0M8G4_9CAEN